MVICKKKLKKIWESLTFCSFIPFGSSYFIYLNKKDYWNIYKRERKGKSFLNIQYQDAEGKSYRFPSAKEYYCNECAGSVEGGRGVYGIYKGEELLYIGYSTNLIARIKQHEQNFINNNVAENPMYGHYNIEELEFKELIAEEEIQDLVNCQEPVDICILQIIEWALIKTLQPKWNREGVTKNYKLRGENTKNWSSKISMAALVRDFLGID